MLSHNGKKKLDLKFKGPLQVTAILDNDRYEVKDPTSNTTTKLAHDNLRKITLPDETVLSQPDSELSSDE